MPDADGVMVPSVVAASVSMITPAEYWVVEAPVVPVEPELEALPVEPELELEPLEVVLAAVELLLDEPAGSCPW